jgi:hypothetical protein
MSDALRCPTLARRSGQVHRGLRAMHQTEVRWNLLGTFEADAATIEARLGPPSARDLDSNGLGPFDCHRLQFDCGLELALWRFHWGRGLRPIDAAREASIYQIYATRPELEHAMHHLGVPHQRAERWTAEDGKPLVDAMPPSVIVMRQDDNGNHFEVTRVTSRCEALSLARDYEARGHKQTYWVEA